MKPLYKGISLTIIVSAIISYAIGLEDLAAMILGIYFLVAPFVLLGVGDKPDKKETNDEPTMILFDKNGNEILRK